MNSESDKTEIIPNKPNHPVPDSKPEKPIRKIPLSPNTPGIKPVEVPNRRIKELPEKKPKERIKKSSRKWLLLEVKKPQLRINNECSKKKE